MYVLPGFVNTEDIRIRLPQISVPSSSLQRACGRLLLAQLASRQFLQRRECSVKDVRVAAVGIRGGVLPNGLVRPSTGDGAH